jgi:hypothetical protein
MDFYCGPLTAVTSAGVTDTTRNDKRQLYVYSTHPPCQAADWQPDGQRQPHAPADLTWGKIPRYLQVAEWPREPVFHAVEKRDLGNQTP